MVSVRRTEHDPLLPSWMAPWYCFWDGGAKQRAMKKASIFSSNISALVAASACSLLMAACTNATPPPEGAHGHHEHGEHGEHGEHDHPEMTGAVREMHDVLAPLWHAPKSPERETKTCEAIPTFVQRAGAIKKNVPESARAKEEAYRTAAQGLVTAVGGLEAECAKAAGGRAEFDAKFHDVHEAFHKVLESLQ